MRRLALALLPVPLLVAALLLASGGSTAAGAAGFPARLQVSADEFHVTLSRLTVPAGRVRVELVNYGEDPHDLKLRRIGTTRVYTIPETLPGARTARTWRLPPGRYRVWCSVAGHKAAGMHALLRVRKRS